MQRSDLPIHIIVPIFNEERYLDASVRGLLKAFSDYSCLAVYLVDDRSWDRSPKVIESLHACYPDRIHPLQNRFGKGKGGAVRTALTQIDQGVIAIHDADLEYMPKDLERMVGRILQGNDDLILGSRFLASNHFLLTQKLQNQLLNAFIRVFSRQSLTDVASCYKVFDAGLIRNHAFRFSGFGFDFELAALLLKRTSSLVEVPISFAPRTVADGKKLKPWHGISAVFAFLTAYLVTTGMTVMPLGELPPGEV